MTALFVFVSNFVCLFVCYYYCTSGMKKDNNNIILYSVVGFVCTGRCVKTIRRLPRRSAAKGLSNTEIGS